MSPFTIILLLSLFILSIIIIKSYNIKTETIIAYTGGLGSGKSYLSTQTAIKLYKKSLSRVRLYNFFHKSKKRDIPELYSSIPLRINKKKYSLQLTDRHLLLQDRIIPRSVVYIDEIGSFCNQFEYRNKNALDNFEEFIRLFRHYTLGGKLVINDQCSENIVLQIRRRINNIYNLYQFKKIWFLYLVKVRMLNISEDIKTIESTSPDKKNEYRILWGFLKKGRYDTYCYSNRYNAVDTLNNIPYTALKKNLLLEIPKEKVTKKTAIYDNENGNHAEKGQRPYLTKNTSTTLNNSTEDISSTKTATKKKKLT